jgi:lipoic acid synthetase
MVGLGESFEEILQTMDDLLDAGCSIMTIGQYLRPSPRHYPVMEYIQPEIFSELKKIALEKGFKAAECGPLVRSSYHASEYKI